LKKRLASYFRKTGLSTQQHQQDRSGQHSHRKRGPVAGK
jgi:hypothetical protein